MTTVILFIALFASLKVLDTYLSVLAWYFSPNFPRPDTTFAFVLDIICCLSWALFYYLLH